VSFLGHSVETSGELTIQQHIQMKMEKEHVAACAELTLLQMKLISFEITNPFTVQCLARLTVHVSRPMQSHACFSLQVLSMQASRCSRTDA